MAVLKYYKGKIAYTYTIATRSEHYLCMAVNEEHIVDLTTVMDGRITQELAVKHSVSILSGTVQEGAYVLIKWGGAMSAEAIIKALAHDVVMQVEAVRSFEGFRETLSEVSSKGKGKRIAPAALEEVPNAKKRREKAQPQAPREAIPLPPWIAYQQMQELALMSDPTILTERAAERYVQHQQALALQQQQNARINNDFEILWAQRVAASMPSLLPVAPASSSQQPPVPATVIRPIPRYAEGFQFTRKQDTSSQDKGRG